MFRKTSLCRVHILVVIISAFFATACPQPYSLQELVDGPDGKALTVSPTSALLQINDSLPIETSGGIPPYSYTVVSGSGVFTGNIFTAPPAPGSERVRVTDKAGTSVEAVFTVNSAGLSLGITPSSGTVYTGGSINFSPIGGMGPFAFALTTNASGGSVNVSSGVYMAGSAPGTDVVTVTDTSDASTATAMVTVQAKPLSISPETITVYVNQAVNFSAVGGDGPFNYTLGMNGSGAPPMSGATYTAGPAPGSDTVVLTDDNDGRIRTATVTVVTTATGVDYAAMPVTITDPGDLLAGTNFTAEFSIVNNGLSAGSKTIYWTVYASTDTAIGGVDDRIAASGSLGGTAAGLTTPVSFAGTWPSEAGLYYLLVEVYAADDLSPADNRNGSAGQTQIYEPVRISPAVAAVYTGQTVAFIASGGTGIFVFSLTTNDSGGTVNASTGVYTAGSNPGTDVIEVSDSVYPGWTAAVAAISVALTPPPPAGDVEYTVSSFTAIDTTPNAGSPIGESFTLRNSGTDPGSASVNWAVYLSQNNTPAFTAGDQIAGSGSVSALAGNDGFAGGPDETSVAITGSWPSSAGTWYLKVKEWADDETTPNEWFVSSPFSVQSVSVDVDYYVSVPPAGGSVSLGAVVSAGFTAANQGTDAGSAAVSWYAYISSDTVYNTGDTLVDSGTFGGLAAGGSSGLIPIDSGTWTTVGNWYLLVRLEAADEINTSNNLRPSGAVYSVTDPGALAPDYIVSFISDTFPIVTAESAVSETFTITNIGSAGASDITWTAYASTDKVLGGDTVIGSGTIPGGLGAGAGVSGISINGFWPNLSGDFYIIVQVDADDETNRNDIGVSDDPVTVRLPPDYLITGTVFDAINNGGNINETLLSAGGGVRPGFRIRENGGQSGLHSITWRVYRSTDQTLGGDTQIAVGTIPALAAGQTSTLIEFDDTLPGIRGVHYYIIQVSSPDDRDLTNNVLVTPPMYYWSDGNSANGTTDGVDGDNSETDQDEDDIYLNMAEDYFIKLNPGDTVKIIGIIDKIANYSDLFLIRTGPATTTLNFNLSWATGSDVDLYLFDASGSLITYSNTATAGSEVLNVSGLTAGTYYYLDVRTYSFTAPPPNDQPYTLMVTAP